MDNAISKLLINFASISAFIPVIVGLIQRKKLQYKTVRNLLLVFVMLSLFFESIASITSYFEIRNLHVLHIYTIVEFSMIVYIFSKAKSKIFSTIVRNILLVGFGIFAIINAFYLEGFQHFNANVRTVESLLLIGLVLLYFYTLITDPVKVRLEKMPMFWFSVAILLYFSGNLITFLLSEYALSSDKVIYTIWGFHAIITIVKNMLFTFALWIQPYKQTSPFFS